MASSVSVGDKVTTTAEYDVNGTHLASFVRTNTYDVIQVGGKNLPASRIVIGKGSAVTAAVDISTLTVVSGKTTPAPPTPTVPTTPTVVEKVTTVKTISGGSDLLADKILGNYSGVSFSFDKTTIDGSKVQYMNERYDTTYSKDYAYTINSIIAKREQKTLYKSWVKSIEQNHPSIVQNNLGGSRFNFPVNKGFDSKAGYYRYNYYQDMDKQLLTDGLRVSYDDNEVRKSVNADIFSRGKLFQNYANKYNKFKIDNPNDRLSKSFAHVFFVRPDCNIFKTAYTKSGNLQLVDNLENLSEFYYAKKHCPELLRQLTQPEASFDHQFMLYPSNKARSFEVADEYITADTYGTALTGYKIPYGKDNVESKTAGKFSINYVDDRDLHVYHLHKLWSEYISYVFRGKINPKDIYILNKIIDYATCVYYILTAEDGETIIFWSKYWGVFPIESPSSGFSFSLDNPGGVKDPELKIEYQYAWKEDFNPLTLIEFNTHSSKKYKYVNNYQNIKLGTGYTWAGAPFIETFNNGTLDLPYTFKLRFRPEPKI